MQQAIGAQKTLQQTTAQSTKELLGARSASAQLDAALLGLRTAAGSAAVIGLGAMSLAAIAAGKALRAVVIETAAFEQELNTFQALTGATAAQIDAVADAAERLGADITLPAVSASDAAVAMTELAKAGLTVQESIAGAEGVLQLATAAQISNAEAAEIAANSLNSFGLAGDQAIRVADGLANAANASQGSILDLGIAMRQVSAVARQVGLSLEDTEATLALFAKNGLAGSDAGTAFRVAILRLVAPTKDAAAEIKNLGLQVRDAEGNFRADVFAQFGEATRRLTPAARDAAAALIFGQDAIRAVSIGAREGADGLELMQARIDQVGTAAEIAGARTQGLAGSFSGLSSNAQTFGVAIGGLITGPLKQLTDAVSNTLALATNLVDQFKRLGEIKIPPIHIPIVFENEGGGGFNLGDVFGKVIDFSLFGSQGPFGQLSKQAKELNKDIQQITDPRRFEIGEQIATLTDRLKQLQKAKIEALEGGAPNIARGLTPQIEGLKQQIKDLQRELENVDSSRIGTLNQALERLESVSGGRVTPAIRALRTIIAEASQGLGRGADESNRLETGLFGVASAADLASAALARAAARVADLTRQSAALGDQLLKLQSEGGTPQQQIGVLQADIQTQRDIISAAKSGGIQAGDPTTIRKARQKIIADQNEVRSLQAGIAADRKKAVDEAKKRAKDAADQAEAETKAFIESFGGGRARRLRQAELAAGLTEDARDDKAVDERIRKFLLAKRKAIRDRIKELNLHGAALKAARDAIKKINDEIDNINNEIAQDQQQVGQQQVASIQLDIDLAATQENNRKEIAARKRLIKVLQQQLALTKKGTLEYKRLRNAIAEQNAAIEELNKEKKKQGKSLAQSQFEFLQSLQGFSANLLGNLIPGFATGGLVGGSGGGDQGPSSLAQMQTRVDQSTAITGARERTVRPVQVDTTNALLRQILRTLQGRPAAPPEIRFNRGNAASEFDTLPGN